MLKEILGKLKIPGYSDYLHPYDENHIIGIGKDTVEFIDSELGIQLCNMEGIPNIVVGTIAKIGDIFATDLNSRLRPAAIRRRFPQAPCKARRGPRSDQPPNRPHTHPPEHNH